MESIEILPVRIKIASILRKAILSGEFAAGQELSLVGTANQLGVSRTPVREAFLHLAAEGLIELRMNKGAVVRAIDKDFIRDHFEIRALLEGEAIARAIKNRMDPRPLTAIQNRIITDCAPGGENTFTDYNLAFHSAIWNAAGSPKLRVFLETLWNGPSVSRAVTDEEHRRQSIAEHGRMIGFIAEGKAPEGRDAMVRHIGRGLQNMLDAHFIAK